VEQHLLRAIHGEQVNRVVGADLSCTSPIYRPGEGIDEPLADKSAVRQ
jgi:hypothetical protein